MFIYLIFDENDIFLTSITMSLKREKRIDSSLFISIDFLNEMKRNEKFYLFFYFILFYFKSIDLDKICNLNKRISHLNSSFSFWKEKLNWIFIFIFKFEHLQIWLEKIFFELISLDDLKRKEFLFFFFFSIRKQN